MTDPDPPALPWWLWPNVLALDAPAVAVVWQRFFASEFGVGVPLTATAVLGLVVCGIYLADRRLDGQAAHAVHPRHVFAARHSVLVSTLAITLLLAAAVLAFTLPLAYLGIGAIIAACVGGYFVLIHGMKPTTAGGKELLVGVLFAAGVAIPLLVSEMSFTHWLPAVTGFGCACWLNCRLIDYWEEGIAGSRYRMALIAFTAVGCAMGSPFPIAVALILGVGLLGLVHVSRRWLGTRLARVLADVVLLTPLIVWFA